MNLQSFIHTLQECHALEQKLKARGMIYQAGAKEEAAKAFNRPSDYFYNFPYAKWSRVSRWLFRKEQAKRVISYTTEPSNIATP
jgi:hypothetical protein